MDLNVLSAPATIIWLLISFFVWFFARPNPRQWFFWLMVFTTVAIGLVLWQIRFGSSADWFEKWLGLVILFIPSTLGILFAWRRHRSKVPIAQPKSTETIPPVPFDSIQDQNGQVHPLFT
ncbi:MAG: hypothetical protein R3B53_01340 [Candidatus Paceibacterota bacterium]